MSLLMRSVVRGIAVKLIIARTCYRRRSASCDYRGMLEMMVEIKCKLMGTPIITFGPTFC